MACVNTTTLKVKEIYPDIHFYMLGHSMGSFVARNYIVKYEQDSHCNFIFNASGFENLINF